MRPRQIEEMLLGGELRYTRVQAVELAGVTEEFARRLWQAFGFAHLPPDAVAFTEGDVAALCQIQQLLQTGTFDEDIAIRMVRAVGQTMARLAEWQIDILVGAMTGPLDASSPGAVQLVAEVAERHIADFEPLIVHAWRRQLAASGTRALAVAAAQEDTVPARVQVAVGFADMVSFTQLSRELDEGELARLVERFEETAADVIAELGGRLVKTLGDEVLFSAETPRLGAEIALRLATAIKANDDVPDVRIGMAYGPVLPLMGDVFGPTVNLAARLTSIARPGTVLVDAGLATELDEGEAYRLVRIVRRPVRGFGIVQPYVLRAAR